MDDLPSGTNLMVACISYTGYDMEDACIINKMARERGLMYGTIYKTKIIDMGDIEHAKQKVSCTLGCRDPEDPGDGLFLLFSVLLPFFSDTLQKEGIETRVGRSATCWR